jgi:DeoR/GlpR family transcriptional regulator of sugar metabolism
VYFALILSLSAEYIAAPEPTKLGLRDSVTVSVSAFSLSEMTGIPRETVRRKLTILMREKLITRHQGGAYTLTMSPAEITEFIEDTGLASTRDKDSRNVLG